jgi:hypothetical protein
MRPIHGCSPQVHARDRLPQPLALSLRELRQNREEVRLIVLAL